MDQILERYNLKDNEFYKINKLYSIMKEMGLVSMTRESFTNDWLRIRRNNGKIVLPPKNDRNYYLLSGKVIKDIIKAFAPGGTGEYNYQK